ncbi:MULTISPECIES: hypothetical protein [Burkholderia cepacia complex]|nr:MULTISPECIES: hypothetical protein [Burkholderia cepacia complex]MBR7919699.1 hypothetical protein [Burkholderia vietnamiensis]MBR8205348.1 hypothetical protein [Burkholderia vietnamiensis]HDR9131996.1 hypothetical protein [Burkholderia vietnamiensis]
MTQALKSLAQQVKRRADVSPEHLKSAVRVGEVLSQAREAKDVLRVSPRR